MAGIFCIPNSDRELSTVTVSHFSVDENREHLKQIRHKCNYANETQHGVALPEVWGE